MAPLLTATPNRVSILRCNVTGELTGCDVSTEGKVDVTETRAIGLYGNFAVLVDDACRNRSMNLRLSADHYGRVSRDSTTFLIQSHSDLNWHCLCALHLEATWRASHLRR